jgi:hypothetical protein
MVHNSLDFLLVKVKPGSEIDTAFLPHFFPGKIELLRPKFADRLGDLAINTGFFNAPEL